jgi:predicted MFS family arabinose efflux permease
VVYVLAFGLIPGFSVDNWAHVGGLAAGFVLGYVAGTPVRSSYSRETAWRALAGVCIALTVLSFWLMYRNFPAPDQLR